MSQINKTISKYIPKQKSKTVYQIVDSRIPKEGNINLPTPLSEVLSVHTSK